MSLLKRKNQQRDFFVLDIADVVPKDDTLSMEHPIFSLSTKPDMRIRKYENREKVLEVVPSGVGLATIHDKDVLIWAISKIVHAKNRGRPYSKEVRGSAHDLLSATNRPVTKLAYNRLKQAFTRLRGTTFVSNIPLGDNRKSTSIFGLVDSADFIYNDKSDRLDEICVVLSDWLFEAVEKSEVLSISEDYFLLRRPLERRIYEIARKFCGSQSQWKIGLDKLQLRTGSNAPLKKFRHNIRQIISDNNTPFYRIELTSDDTVVFRPRSKKKVIRSDISLPEWAEEQARKVATEKGRDYHSLLHEWQAFATSSALPDNAGAAFIGFCKKKQSLR